jgi:hypothetical protein
MKRWEEEDNQEIMSLKYYRFKSCARVVTKYDYCNKIFIEDSHLLGCPDVLVIS